MILSALLCSAFSSIICIIMYGNKHGAGCYLLSGSHGFVEVPEYQHVQSPLFVLFLLLLLVPAVLLEHLFALCSVGGEMLPLACVPLQLLLQFTSNLGPKFTHSVTALPKAHLPIAGMRAFFHTMLHVTNSLQRIFPTIIIYYSVFPA